MEGDFVWDPDFSDDEGGYVVTRITIKTLQGHTQ
jgi:hypothetical protein